MLIQACVLALLICTASLAHGQAIAWLWDGAQLPAWSQDRAAVLEQHILLSGESVLLRSRARQPALAEGTQVTPVLHVEVSTVNPPRDIETSRAVILRGMRAMARRSSSGWVQLDMEAKPSQRDFYRSLVRQIRAELPPSLRLSVTALAWWCRSPAWLDDLGADEVVPMFFRMGRDGPAMRRIIEDRPQALHASCRGASAGFSPQEPFTSQTVQRYANTYWFDMHAWHRDLPGFSPNDARIDP